MDSNSPHPRPDHTLGHHLPSSTPPGQSGTRRPDRSPRTLHRLRPHPVHTLCAGCGRSPRAAHTHSKRRGPRAEVRLDRAQPFAFTKFRSAAAELHTSREAIECTPSFCSSVSTGEIPTETRIRKRASTSVALRPLVGRCRPEDNPANYRGADRCHLEPTVGEHRVDPRREAPVRSYSLLHHRCCLSI